MRRSFWVAAITLGVLLVGAVVTGVLVLQQRVATARVTALAVSIRETEDAMAPFPNQSDDFIDEARAAALSNLAQQAEVATLVAVHALEAVETGATDSPLAKCKVAYLDHAQAWVEVFDRAQALAYTDDRAALGRYREAYVAVNSTWQIAQAECGRVDDGDELYGIFGLEKPK